MARTLDISHEATTVIGSGQVQVPSTASGSTSHPSSRAARRGRSARRRKCTNPRTATPPRVPTRRRPAARSRGRIADGRVRCHSSSKRSTREPGRGEDRGVEAPALVQPREQRAERAGRVPPGQLGHRGCGQRVRRVRARLRSPKRAVERRSPGSAPRATARFSSSAPRRSHSPAAHAAYPSSNQSGTRHVHLLVQGQMGQLVPEGAGEVVAVGPDHDGAESRAARPPAPQRGARPSGERVEPPAVGHHHESQRRRRRAGRGRATPPGGPACSRQRDGESHLRPATRPR